MSYYLIVKLGFRITMPPLYTQFKQEEEKGMFGISQRSNFQKVILVKPIPKNFTI